VDGALAIAIKRSMRGQSKKPRAAIAESDDEDDEEEAELELDGFKYKAGSSDTGGDSSEIASPTKLGTKRSGRPKYSSFLPRKRRRVESDDAVHAKTPFKGRGRPRASATTMRRRLNLGRGAAGEGDRDHDDSDDDEEDVLDESLFEGGGGVAGVGNKDHPYDELATPAGNLCSLRSTLLRMEEQLRDSLYSAGSPWYVKTGEGSSGSSSGARKEAGVGEDGATAGRAKSALEGLKVKGPLDLSSLPRDRGLWVAGVRTATSPSQLSRSTLLLEAQVYTP